MNDFSPIAGKRDLLLGIVFAIIYKQFTFAYRLAMKGSNNSKDNIFDKIKESLKNYLVLKNKPKKYNLKERIIRSLIWRLEKLL